MADGETYQVIELKPNNSRAVKGGQSQANGYVEELNDELKKAKDSRVMQKLIGVDSDFAKCKQFRSRVDCYTLCPTVDDEGNFREPRTDWKKDCS